MRIGLFGGDTSTRTIDELVDDARAAEADGFASFYLPQIFGLDSMAVLTVVGREVPRVELGTFVVPTYTRTPLAMAQQALTVQAASGNRFALGIGLSHQIVIETMLGQSFEKPLRHMREYLSLLLPLLREGKANFEGETMRGALQVATVGTTPPQVVIAALGPKMLELAGTVAEGTATWMTGPKTLSGYTIPAITAAATKAGRPAPRIITSLPISVTNDVAASKERAAKDFLMYGFLPSYRAMLDREGAEGPADVAIAGDEDVVAAGINELADVGVTDFIASIYGTREERDRTHALLKSLL